MIEWLEHRDYDRHVVQNLLAPSCCVFEKDTLRHFPLLGGLGKRF